MNTSEKLHLIWADKIVLTVAVLAFAGCVALWVLVALAAGLMGANHVLASVGYSLATEGVATLAALWASLRGLDFIFHGSTWRLFHTVPDIVETPVALGGNLIAR